MKRERREVHTGEQVLVLLALVLAEPVPGAVRLHDPARVRAQDRALGVVPRRAGYDVLVLARLRDAGCGKEVS